VLALIEQRRQVRVENSLRDYIVQVVRATRGHAEIELGASPRAALALYGAAQAWAAIAGRDFVLPDDIKTLAPHVLTHRMLLSPQAQLRGRRPEELVAAVVNTVPVPVEQ
ncbi:MAG: AAA family ATPase, partial [Chloroflexota bacterium]